MSPSGIPPPLLGKGGVWLFGLGGHRKMPAFFCGGIGRQAATPRFKMPNATSREPLSTNPAWRRMPVVEVTVPPIGTSQGPATRGSTPGNGWFLLAAFLGWLFDGFEIGLFPVIARPALKNLLGGGGRR